MAEQLLPGGFVSRVVRDGDTVRRDPGNREEFVRELLRHFGQRGWTGAPRLLGIDGQGREVLTFLDGYVAWQDPSARVSSAGSLAGVARLVRQFHDLTAGTRWPAAGKWYATTTFPPGIRSTGITGRACGRSLSWTGTWQRRAPAFTT